MSFNLYQLTKIVFCNKYKKINIETTQSYCQYCKYFFNKPEYANAIIFQILCIATKQKKEASLAF